MRFRKGQDYNYVTFFVSLEGYLDKNKDILACFQDGSTVIELLQ